MSVIVKGGGGENVKAEVTAQVPIIQGIADNFGVEITTPSGTNKQILQGNNANLQIVEGEAKSRKYGVFLEYQTISGRHKNILTISRPDNTPSSRSLNLRMQDFDFKTNLLVYTTNVNIIADILDNGDFYDFFKNLGFYLNSSYTIKTKVDAKQIYRSTFNKFGASTPSSIPLKIWFSKKFDTTKNCTSSGGILLDARSNIDIYCENESAPSGLENYWNYSNNKAFTTMWGVTEEQFDAL